jgi:hypothetical protein
MRSKNTIGSDSGAPFGNADERNKPDSTLGEVNNVIRSGLEALQDYNESVFKNSLPPRLHEIMDQAVSNTPKLTVKRGGKLSVELPVKPPAGFQTTVNVDLRTPAEVAAGERSPFRRIIDGSPAHEALTIDGVTSVGPDDDVELNAVHRFRLEPDDGQPVEFVGSLIARAAVQRGDSQHTWVGLYRTRGGKIISEIVRDDGRAQNVAARLGDRFRSVKVFDTVEVALASIRSAVLRNQLLGDLGLLKTKFID